MTTQTTSTDVRVVPIEQIVVVDDFNPRTSFEETELRRLATSIGEVGILQPLTVYPTDDPERLELGDGERRYRAAQLAELTDVPVIVRARDADRDGHELVEALTVNLHREEHTPIEEARAFARLLDAGLTRKGITQRLGVSRDRVRERLQLLELPAELHPSVDDGSIPLQAVRTLLELAAIHPELPGAAAAKVGAPPRHAWGEPLSWADVADDPLGAVLPRYGDETPELPAGVYDADWAYSLACFTLAENADKDLTTLVELEPEWVGAELVLGRDPEVFAQAETLGAAHASPNGSSRIVVGQDVCDQLAGDIIKRALKRARQRRRQEAEQRRQQAEAAGQDGAVAAAGGEQAAEQEQERRQAERAAEQQRRADAERFNDDLGAAVYRTLATVKPDDATVMKILTAIDLTTNEIAGLAALGMRYGWPGWVGTEEARGGKTKRVYLTGSELADKLAEFLEGATTAAEIAGRCLSVVVMAALADEDCVARSNRAMHSLHAYRDAYGIGARRGLPWQQDTLTLVEDLAIERLPEKLTGRLRERREEAARQKAAAEAAEQVISAAAEQLRRELPDMDNEQRMAATEAFEAEHGRFGQEAMQLRRLVVELIDADAIAAADQDGAAKADVDADVEQADADSDADVDNQAAATAAAA